MLTAPGGMRILVPQPSIEPVLPQLELWVVTRGPPGKSRLFLFYIEIELINSVVFISSV